ncbi:MAG TPA: Uma2 family endonuclease [Thermoanaerobaculaceae bacterium]|nr:Uma2 family endonuclease [Thermoanaerobaculaceae bacterium]HPS77264.1 Uma2 family endonuclease [Thermoanaerobaculaceae bacterium]
MAETARKLATYADIVHLPEGENLEILDGEVSLAPRSVAAHGRAQMALSHDIGGSFEINEDPGGWWIVIEPEGELLAHDVYILDLADWRRSRAPTLPETRPVRVAPGWVCEVTSPSTSRNNRVRKADGCLRGGVSHYWLVDIESCMLEAWEARDGAWVRLGAWTEDDSARISPFDAVELRIGRLFPPAPPHPPDRTGT